MAPLLVAPIASVLTQCNTQHMTCFCAHSHVSQAPRIQSRIPRTHAVCLRVGPHTYTQAHGQHHLNGLNLRHYVSWKPLIACSDGQAQPDVCEWASG